MKKIGFSKALLTFFAVLLLLGTLCTVAFAADEVKNCGLAYGEIVPTDANLKAQKTKYDFYGDSGALYFMRISKGKENAWFAVEIYADSGYKEQIRSFKDEYSATPGNKPLSITWNFKTIASGTYYGRCYTYYLDGDNKITDTSSFKTFTININRISKREVPLKSLTTTSNGMKITWGQVPTATKYNVYRRAAGEKSWKYLTTLGADATSYTDTTPKSGTYYAYTVKCGDGKNVSLYNKKGLLTYYIAQPKIKGVAGVYSSGAAQLKWEAVNGAKGYYIYRKGGSLSNYDWKLIATIKNGKTTSYIDYKATSSDWNYTYTVKAFNGKYNSSHNAAGVEFNYIPAPKITKVGPHQNGVEITWNAPATNVTKYYVYRKNGASWKLVGTTTATSFVDKSVASNNTYTYTVKAACKTNVGAFNQKGVSVKYIATPKLKSLSFDYSYRGIVKWEPVNGAAGYKIYRKVNDGKSWYLLATVKNGKASSYTDTMKKYSGAKYTYTVRAYDSKNVHSWFVPNGISDICLAKPVFAAAQKDTADKSLAMEISWNKVNGATKYNVYRRLPGGKWAHLKDGVKELSYIDATIESGVAYQYAVRALNDTGSISWYYTKTATAVAAPKMTSVAFADTGVKAEWSAVKNAEEYKLYRAKFGDTSWTFVGTSKTTSFVDTLADAKVSAYRYCVSAVSNGVESIKSVGLSNLTEITATAKYDSEKKAIVLEWNAPLADTVIVTKVTGTDEPVEIGVFSTVTTKSYTDLSVEPGKKYTYRLTAQSSTRVNGIATVTQSCPLPPLVATKIKAIEPSYNDGDPICTVSWEPVEFASEYEVLRSTDGKEYTKVATVKADQIKDDGLLYCVDPISAEIAYSYRIKAISSEDRAPSTTGATPNYTAYRPLDALADLRVVSSEIDLETQKVTVTIKWAPTAKAEAYTIHRMVEGGDYQVLGSFIVEEGESPETTFVDSNAQINTKYTYKVTASSAFRGSVSNTVDFERKVLEAE